MALKISIDTTKFNKLSRAGIQALKKTATAVLSDVVKEQVIPFDTGTLQNTATFVDDSDAEKGEVSIVCDTPYARKLYYHPEFHFQTINNANAKGNWFDDWIDGSKKDYAQKAFKILYKREAGGMIDDT